METLIVIGWLVATVIVCLIVDGIQSINRRKKEVKAVFSKPAFSRYYDFR